MTGRYETQTETDETVIKGKLACVKKGIAFCKRQLMSAVEKFKTALSGSSHEECLNIGDVMGGEEDDAVSDEDADDDEDGDDENEEEIAAVPDTEATNSNSPNANNISIVGENISQTDLFLWKFPSEVSQSTLDGRNGSSACSVIAVIMAHGIWHQRLQLQATPLLSPLWVMLLCAAIRVGNRLYDRCRHSLPQRYLSASEAAAIAEQCFSMSVDVPLPVRAFDEHAPSTLLFQLKELCTGDRGDGALLIANEKTVLFVPVGNSSIALVDTHRHDTNGAILLLGQQNNLDQFIHVCQSVLDLSDDTYGNLSAFYYILRICLEI